MISKSIGFFGGTFDPIHNGHLNLAIELKEREGLEEVWICPTWQNPFKDVKGADPEHRLEMCKLAIEGLNGFKVIDIEVKSKKTSFTIDTIKTLDRPFRLILGDDQMNDFSKWKDVSELKKLAPPLIGSRYGKEGCINIPIMDISSTVIRERLKKGLPCAHLLPYKVLDYIGKNRLYSCSLE